jgi:hypothetical protein
VAQQPDQEADDQQGENESGEVDDPVEEDNPQDEFPTLELLRRCNKLARKKIEEENQPIIGTDGLPRRIPPRTTKDRLLTEDDYRRLDDLASEVSIKYSACLKDWPFERQSKGYAAVSFLAFILLHIRRNS